ncbi:MAG TPA: Na+/H+ antiporter NhaC [Pseudobacillus sp.]
MAQTLSAKKAITLLVVSILILFGGIVFIKAPSTIVLIASGIAAITLSLLWGIKWDKIEKDIIENLRAMLIPILILLSVGMLIGAWMLSGTIPIIVYYGMTFLNPSIFLLVTALACAFMSVMAGTSWGTIGTVGVALMGVSAGLGIPLHYTAGAIVVGAIFGDKLSPLSDSTVMTSAVTDVNLVEHIRHLLYTTIPGFVISLILYFVLGFQFDGQSVNKENVNMILSTLDAHFNLNPILFLPPVVVLVLIYMRKPTLPVFGVGILLGCVISIIFQGRGILDIANVLNEGFTHATKVEVVDQILQRGGLSSMLETVALLIAAAVFGSPLQTAGVVGIILDGIKKLAKQSKSMMLSCLTLHGLFFTITGSYYVSYAVLGPMLKTLYDKYGLHRKNLSRTMEDTGTAFAPMIPWSVTGAFIVNTLGVPVKDYILYSPMVYLGVVFALIYIFTGYGIAKAVPDGKLDAKQERVTQNM